MAVEVFILSGARRGERVALDLEKFDAGADRRCEICFDPNSYPAARNRRASFQLQGDGWYVWRSGEGKILVNRETVEGPRRLRSGDVVGMSESGPNFTFTVTAGASAAATVAPAFLPPLPPPLPVCIEPELLLPASRGPIVSPPVPPPLLAAPPVPTAPAGDAARPLIAGREMLLVAGGALLCLICFIAARLLVAPQPVIIAPPKSDSAPTPEPRIASPPASRPGSTPADSSTSASGPLQFNTPAPRALATGSSASNTLVTSVPASGLTDLETPVPNVSVLVLGPAAPDWTRVESSLKGAVLLIQVEKGKGQASAAWPFATCAAIRNDTVLTSASVACELAKFRRDGFNIWITDPSGQARLEAREIRIPAEYPALADKPVERRCFNLAIVETRGKLDKLTALGLDSDPIKLEDGLPVACFGFSFVGSKITKYDRFVPGLAVGRVFQVMSPLPHVPGVPQSLDVVAKIPENAFGSPLVNQQGKVVAVYGEPTKSEEANGLTDHHFAAAVSERMLNAWLQDRNTTLWVPPAVTERPAAPHGR